MDVIQESRWCLKHLNWQQVYDTIDHLRQAKRVFCVGNGGGYAHAMHFASDLRKIAGIQAYSFDNVAEMTARINDDGWENAWADWLDSHHYGRDEHDGDYRFLFSVNGGAVAGNLSLNLKSPSLGIVGEKGAYQHRIVIPSTSTPVIEGCQSVIAHHIVEQLQS